MDYEGASLPRLSEIAGRPGAADAFDPARSASDRRLKTYTAYARYLVMQTLRATPDLKAWRVPGSPFLLRSLLDARGGLTLQAADVCAWDLGIPGVEEEGTKIGGRAFTPRRMRSLRRRV